VVLDGKTAAIFDILTITIPLRFCVPLYCRTRSDELVENPEAKLEVSETGPFPQPDFCG